MQTSNKSGSTHSKGASSDSKAEIHHLTDFTVRSRDFSYRNQHVSSQSWEELGFPNESYDSNTGCWAHDYVETGTGEDGRPTFNEMNGIED